MKETTGTTIKIKWDWFGVIFAIVALILNAEQIIYCWPCYMVSAVFMTIHFIPKKEYPFLLLTAVYFCLDIWAWYSWAVKVAN